MSMLPWIMWRRVRRFTTDGTDETEGTHVLMHSGQRPVAIGMLVAWGMRRQSPGAMRTRWQLEQTTMGVTAAGDGAAVDDSEAAD
jgi:hypothetical protein